MKSLRHLLFLFFPFALIASCENKNDYSISGDKNYQRSTASLSETEQKNPARFLTVAGSKRKNFIRQTVISGKVFNNAKIIAYKDVDILISFYSSTGALLEEDRQIVYQKIIPGGTGSFKSKYFPPKDTDSVGMKVITAKF